MMIDIDRTIIRQIQENDYPQIVTYMNSLNKDSNEKASSLFCKYNYTIEELNVLCSSELCVAYVAEFDTDVLGFIMFNRRRNMKNSEFKKREYLTINYLYVGEAFRGKGLGNKLMKKVIEYARMEGICEVNVNVLANSDLAIAFYKSMGFSSAMVLMQQLI